MSVAISKNDISMIKCLATPPPLVVVELSCTALLLGIPEQQAKVCHSYCKFGIFCDSFIFAKVHTYMRKFMKIKPSRMAKSLCRFADEGNHALVANLNVANIPFNAIRENKNLAKISDLTLLYLLCLSIK